MKKQFFSLCIICISFIVQAQTGPRLVGMTPGNIFQYTGGANSLSATTSIPNSSDPQSSTLIEGPNGKLYGLLSYANGGQGPIVVQYDYYNNSTALESNYPTLNYGVCGHNPYGSFVMAYNGTLYGITRYSYNGFYCSAADGGGMLFSYSISDSTVTGILILPYGAVPVGSMIQSADSNLYGMTVHDGTNSGGTIFSYNIDSATYTSLYSLPDSAFPYGSLLEVGKDTLYGMTQYDGSNKGGTIFRYITTTGTYAVLYDLPAGANPTGSLIHAHNGQLYGMTVGDGTNHQGTIFSYNTGSGIFTVLHQSGGYGDLYQASDGILYGVSNGTLFQYNIATSTYTARVTGVTCMYGHLTEYMSAILTEPSDIQICAGSPVRFVAADTASYATVQWQVSMNGGTSFSNISGAIDTVYSFNASSAQNGYLYRAVFTHSPYSDTTNPAALTLYSPAMDTITTSVRLSYTIGNRIYDSTGTYIDTIHGASVYGCDSIVLLHLTVLPPAIGPILLGCTSEGGVHSSGSIIHYIGGDSIISGEYSFPQNAYNFGCENISLTRAPNGKLYGTSAYGGPSAYGNIFEYDLVSNSYVSKALFDSITGFHPSGSLLLAGNGLFYGITNFGGAYGQGTIFSYAMDSSYVTKLVDMQDGTGYDASLMQAANGRLYGLTLSGGGTNYGSLFEYDIPSGIFNTVLDFPFYASPEGRLTEVGADTLYGFTTGDGIHNAGTLFRYVIGQSTDTVLYNYGYLSDLMLATDGKLYGTSYSYGLYTNNGFMFDYDISTGIFTDLHDFGTGQDGKNPQSGLIQASNGMIYGTTFDGGTHGPGYAGATLQGTVFQYDIAHSTYTKKVDLDSSTGYNPLFGRLTEYRAFPTVYKEPISQSVCPGSGAVLSSAASGVSVSVQWQMSTDGGATFSNIAGATDTTYSFSAPSSRGSYLYRAVFSDTVGSTFCVAAALTVYMPLRDTVYASICPGDSYTFLTRSYSSVGTYTDTIPGAAIHGCDSIVILRLTIYHVATDTITASICPGTGYSFMSHIYTLSGHYTDTLYGGAIHGCDSIATLYLTIYPASSDTVTTTICPGSDYRIGTHTYSSPGTYSVSLPGASVNGCDSIVRLYLSIDGALPTVTWPDPDTIFCGALPLFISLSGGEPAGGVYRGLYVQGNTINSADFGAYSGNHAEVYYILTDSIGCSDSASHLYYYFGLCDGIAESSPLMPVILYPNPTSGIFFIQHQYTGQVKVIVWSLIGDKLKEFTMIGPQQTFDISDLAAGIYEVQVSDGQQTLKVMKVVKE